MNLTGVTTGALYKRYQGKDDLFAAVVSDTLQVILSAFWETVYEPFVHDFDWNRLEEHCAVVCRLFNGSAMLGME